MLRTMQVLYNLKLKIFMNFMIFKAPTINYVEILIRISHLFWNIDQTER